MFHRAGISLPRGGDTVSNSGKSTIFFSSDRLWGPPGLLFNYQLSFPGVNRLRGEFYHSSLTTAEVTNEWSCTSTPPYAFGRWRDKLYSFFNFCLKNN